MGFLDDLLGKTAEKASRRAAGIEEEKQGEALSNRIAAGEEFNTSAQDIAQLFGQDPGGTGSEAFEAIAQLLGLRGQSGNEAAIDTFRSTPGFQFAQEEGEQALQRSAQAGGRLTSGRADKDTLRFSQGLADQNVQDFIQNLFGLGTAESGRADQRVANQANFELTGAKGLLGSKDSAFRDRFASASPTAQGVVAGANARSSGAQNLLNAGLTLAGTFAPIPGGNSSSDRRPRFFPGEFNR